MSITLYRVQYGKKDTPPEMREYCMLGSRRVGTLAEYKAFFSDETEFIIVDRISVSKKLQS